MLKQETATAQPRVNRPEKDAELQDVSHPLDTRDLDDGPTLTTEKNVNSPEDPPKEDGPRITFAPVTQKGSSGKHALYIPGPRERENGQ